jgi:hypothetical protein
LDEGNDGNNHHHEIKALCREDDRMIISASRRTDIPAFYTPWLMNRLRAGFCLVPNPFNPRQVSSVSLKPEAVDVIVFWTRNADPLLPHLQELDDRGYRYYFLYTVMNNPRALDPKSPALRASLGTVRSLVKHVGPRRVIWRYDPIVFTTGTGPTFHEKTYGRIARALNGLTKRSVVSTVNVYRKAEGRLRHLKEEGLPMVGCPEDALADMMRSLAHIARDQGMTLFSCAEERDLEPYGIRRGKCVDDEYIQRVFGVEVTHRKDPSQRKACGCVISKDIGMYDTCLYGCVYCYATRSLERVKKNVARHNPASAMLVSKDVSK